MHLDFIPFSFLPESERQRLAEDLTEARYHRGEVIYQQEDAQDKRVFLLLEGRVEQWRRHREYEKRLNVVEPGHYFGERSALFEEPRQVEARAASEVHCLILSGEGLLALLRRSPVFARALGQILRERQKIFVAFDRFMAEVLHGISLGRVDVDALLLRYKDLCPALHPEANNPARVDFAALAYAVRRLPDNLTQALVWFMADELPPLYATPQETFSQVETAARRRAVYQMFPGKNLVLLRDGLSDLVDLLSCLCLYAVEVRKLRKRLQDRELLARLSAFVDQQPQGRRPELELLRSLPFSEQEVEGLRGLWPGCAAARLREIALHHEDYDVRVWKRIGNHNSSHADTWTGQLARATEELLGHRPHELPPEVQVHIISSNTHSVTNCLSAHLASQREQILDWGRRIEHPALQHDWHNLQDLAVALYRDYLKVHPAQRPGPQEGVLELHETAFTGIHVQLFDTQGMALRPMDPALQAPPLRSRALLVNIDYAFGQQAEEIISNLLKLFGPNLASVNILGKAGGLRGQRGDVLLPNAFLRQTDDNFEALAADITAQELAQALPDRQIHQGPVLTVAGTLLQNPVMLHFYQKIWGCVGLEMEGSYYHRPLKEARAMGLVRPDLVARYLYYVSDLPLHTEENLSGSMRAIEGIPPLYAITRVILNSIFDQERQRADQGKSEVR